MQLADTAALESQRITRDTSADKKVLRETTQDITKQVAFPLAMRFTATRLLDLEGRPVRPGCRARLFCSKSFESPIPLSQNMSQSVGEGPGD